MKHESIVAAALAAFLVASAASAAARETRAADIFAFPDPVKAAGEWAPMKGSDPAFATLEAGGKCLCFPLRFAGRDIDRSSWDRSVAFDLSSSSGLRFEARCGDTSGVAGFSLYLESGNGWYAYSFPVASGRGWKEVIVKNSSSSIEGLPAGFGKVKTVRISAWKAGAKDSELFLRGFGAVESDIPAVYIRAESPAPDRSGEGDARVCADALRRLDGYLRGFGCAAAVLSDAELVSSALVGTELLVLPHNPGIPKAAVDRILGFMDSGGKVLAFFSVDSRILEKGGIAPGKYVRRSRNGQFSGIKAGADAMPGAPGLVRQSSWNIQEALPVEGRSRVAARWVDASGAVTGNAIVFSKNLCVMTHVMLDGDNASKAMLLLAMAGCLSDSIWKRASASVLDGAGGFGPFADLKSAESGVRSEPGFGAEASLLVDRFRTAISKAMGCSGLGRWPDAIDAGNEARSHLKDAWCAAQQPGPGEFRGFWCHSAFGVEGMTWDEAAAALSRNGFTAVFPNMCWGGTAYYESSVLPVDGEITVRGDQVAECLAACTKHGIECHVWKVNWNTGGKAPAGFIARMKREGRTQVAIDGNAMDSWLCPSHPENREIEIAAMAEIAAKYEVHGIHFDYIRYPGLESCFCGGCRKRFAGYAGTEIKRWPGDVKAGGALAAKWLQFRRDNITAVVAGVSERVRKARPGVKISAAVFTNWPSHRDSIGQDWKLWCDRGYLDFVCPMDYVEDVAAFSDAVKRQIEWAGKVPVYPGMGLSVWQGGADPCNLVMQIREARKLGAKGFMVFQLAQDEMRDVLPRLGMGITRRNS